MHAFATQTAPPKETPLGLGARGDLWPWTGDPNPINQFACDGQSSLLLKEAADYPFGRIVAAGRTVCAC